MTPADFDRPYVDEATERFVEKSRPEEPRSETRHEPREEQAAEPAPSASEGDEKPAGERKRGWWKRVLS